MRIDSQGNPLEKNVFYELIALGRTIQPTPFLFKRFEESEKGGRYFFEDFTGEEKFFADIEIDSFWRYSQERLQREISVFKEKAAWMEQYSQTLPKCTISNASREALRRGEESAYKPSKGIKPKFS